MRPFSTPWRWSLSLSSERQSQLMTLNGRAALSPRTSSSENACLLTQRHQAPKRCTCIA
jgi:hypothetical protein